MFTKFIYLIIFLIIGITNQKAFAQNNTATAMRVTGFVAIAHPIVSISSDPPVYNFKNSYTVSIPMGINLWKNPKIGFSFEIVPVIKADNSSSKTSNIIIQPGVLVVLANGFNFTGRIAFETSGRYGFTPVLSKTIIKNKNCNYFIALPFPVRFGNDKPTSLTPGLEIGIGF